MAKVLAGNATGCEDRRSNDLGRELS